MHALSTLSESTEQGSHKGSSADPVAAPPTPNGWSREMLRGFREGEPAALNEVWDRYAPEVAALLRGGFQFKSGGELRRFIGIRSSFELQDHLQETFRRAFEPRARQSYDGIRPYGAYLRVIARNLVLEEFRRSARRFSPVAAPVAGAEELAADPQALDPEESLQEQQMRELVRGFLAELGPQERELCRLRFVEGLGQRAAAEALGWGRQRLRNREAKLRAALQRRLEAAHRGYEGERVLEWFGVLTAGEMIGRALEALS